MTFYVDKHRVREGNVIQIVWDCPRASEVRLVIDNGYKTAETPVEPSGSMKIKLNRSKGPTLISIKAKVKDKTVRRKTRVRVSPYDSFTRLDKNSFKDRIVRQKDKLLNFWQRLGEVQRQSYGLLCAIFVIMLVSAFYPPFLSIGLMLIALYLIFSLIKK